MKTSEELDCFAGVVPMLVGYNTESTLGENQILRVVLIWEEPLLIYIVNFPHRIFALPESI